MRYAADLLARVVSQDLIDPPAKEGDLLGLVLDVNRLTLGPSVGLVDQDAGVRKDHAFASGTTGEDHRRP